MRYWVSDGKSAQGPFSAEQLRRLPGFTLDVMVAPEDAQSASEWRPARVFADIQALFAEPLPPPANRSRAAAPKPRETPCKRCGRNMAQGAVHCSDCGAKASDGSLPQAPYPKDVAGRWTALGAAAGLLLGAASAWLLKPAPKPALPPPAAVAPPAAPEPAPAPAPPPAPMPKPRRKRPVAPVSEPVKNPPSVERSADPVTPVEPEAVPKPEPAPGPEPEPRPIPPPEEPVRSSPEPVEAAPAAPKKSVVDMSPEELERYLKRSRSSK